MADTIQIPNLVVLASVTLGGMGGTLHGMRKNMDVFGTLLVGVVTALGAGVLRDLAIARTPVFLYSGLIGYAILGGIGGYLLGRMLKYMNRLVFILDTALIGVWVVLGAQLALLAGLSNVSAITIGALSAIGGGVIRDVLCRDTPTAFSPVQFDAGTAAVTSILYVALVSLVPTWGIAEWVAIIAAALLRAAALHFRWHLPSAVELSERIRGRPSSYDPATGTITRITPTMRFE